MYEIRFMSQVTPLQYFEVLNMRSLHFAVSYLPSLTLSFWQAQRQTTAGF